jgi:hypothetical protein
MQHATIIFRRTVLDVSKGSWTEKHFEPSWRHTESRLPSLSKAAEEGIDPSLGVCGFGPCFVQFREMYVGLDHLLEKKDTSNANVRSSDGLEAGDWFYVMSRTTFLLIQLNDQMVSWSETPPFSPRSQPSPGQNQPPKHQSCMRMVASITALYYT